MATSVIELFEQSSAVCRFDDGSELTAAELADQGRRLAGALAATGAEPGDRIALHLPNGAAAIRLLLACAAGRFVAVCVNTRYREPEVAELVERSGARWPSGALEWAGAPAIAAVGRPDDPFVVFTTSGTTSRPKMVVHHQRSIATHAADVASAFGYGSADVVMAVMPLAGTFGLASLMGAVAGGSRVIVTDFDLAGTATLIADSGVTAVNGSDDMFHRLVASGADLSSIRLGGYARFNTSLDGVVAAAALAGATITGLYGMSEVQALFSLRDPTLGVDDRQRAGGTLVSPEADARVVDGELQVRGPSLMAGYLAEGGDRIDDALTAAHFDDGWFRTGDLAALDGPRSFEFLSRMGDAMRLGGFLVSPAEIEGVIVAIDGIAAAQVVAVDRPSGSRPVAFVIAEPDAIAIDTDAVIARCRERLAIYKVPVHVAVVDEFPTVASANGTKIKRSELRDRAAELLRVAG